MVAQDYAPNRPDHLSIRRGQTLEVIDGSREDGLLMVKVISGSPGLDVQRSQAAAMPTRDPSPITSQGLIPLSCIGEFYPLLVLES